MELKTKQIMQALIKKSQTTNESSERISVNTDNPMNADWLWERMSGIWGAQWIRENGSNPSQDWITGLSSITDQHLQRGVERTITEKLTWPPSLPQFLSLCLDFDTTEAFNRMISKKPALDDVEYYTRAEVGYQCKRVLEDSRARALFNKTFKLKLELKRKGKLPQRNQKLLASESVVNEIDKTISARGDGGTDIEKRMNKIIKNRSK